MVFKPLPRLSCTIQGEVGRTTPKHSRGWQAGSKRNGNNRLKWGTYRPPSTRWECQSEKYHGVAMSWMLAMIRPLGGISVSMIKSIRSKSISTVQYLWELVALAPSSSSTTWPFWAVNNTLWVANLGAARSSAALRMKLTGSSPHDLTNLAMDMGSESTLWSLLAKNYPNPAAFPAPAPFPVECVCRHSQSKATKSVRCMERSPMFDAGVPWPPGS